MAKKQTAVQWLWDISLDRELMARDFEKAMEMEKEQMICAQMDMFFQACEQPYGITYLFSRDNAEEWAEQYYYETYHSSKQ
jgi:hypothetical protein